jgi:hypothetical protein
MWSLRYDPFDLLFRRVTLEGEIAWGKLPLTVELAPSWIFDSSASDIDEMGFDIGARIAWYVQGEPLRGFWVKAHVSFEWFEATLYREASEEVFVGRPNPELCDDDSETGTCKRNINSAVLGLMIGNSTVFGDDGGFALTGGIGIGVALAESKALEVLPCTEADVAAGDPHCPVPEASGTPGLLASYYDEVERIKLLGSLSLGITF